ncbi:hypothetical protein E3U23_07555 [Erythrobacter litoralis]|uniref:hypothetical protein n=1 Tax=Erythrobacter litoralis TaxID=39960 RepID=UPI0024351EDF|nr:hypothetical protein [Erythrobacter litoralis]MDG6079046.1 hypothetical protein [Erythrobacter litoralis]
MSVIAGLPFHELHVDASGKIATPGLPAFDNGVTDVIFLSHGWKNDHDAATKLYTDLISNMGSIAPQRFKSPEVAIVGIFWPAFRYRPDMTLLPIEHQSDDAGGVAGFSDDEIENEKLEAYAKGFARHMGLDANHFAALAMRAADGGEAAESFLSDIRKILLEDSPDAEVKRQHAALLEVPGDELLEILATGGELTVHDPASGNEETLAGFSDRRRGGWFRLSGAKAAVASILNQATYFEMKKRAGTVGSQLGLLLKKSGLSEKRIHLVGHSFGARVVTSVANEMPANSISTLALLQGAFSHNGFGRQIGADLLDGHFRKVVSEKVVSGPVLVTHTHKDTAVSLFYAVASTAAGDVTAGFTGTSLIGGPDDLHGGIGANGALNLDESEVVDHSVMKGGQIGLVRGKVNNVMVDEIVSNHNDVTNREVAELVASAISKTMT